jgi:hypothetical protein
MWGDLVAPLSKKKVKGKMPFTQKKKKKKKATRPFNWPHGHFLLKG